MQGYTPRCYASHFLLLARHSPNEFGLCPCFVRCSAESRLAQSTHRRPGVHRQPTQLQAAHQPSALQRRADSRQTSPRVLIVTQHAATALALLLRDEHRVLAVVHLDESVEVAHTRVLTLERLLQLALIQLEGCD